jgi:hypothetical protein
MGTPATAATGRGRPSSAARRDRELLRFVGRHGAVSIEHVMAVLGVGSTMAYRHVAACAERGLISRVALLRDEPSLLVATREGLHYAGLGLPVAVVSPGSVGHWLRCASAALALGERHGRERVVSERELRASSPGRPPSGSAAKSPRASSSAEKGRAPEPASSSCCPTTSSAWASAKRP